MSIEKLGGTDRLTVTVDGGGTTTVAVAPILGGGSSGAASLPVGKPGQLVGYDANGAPVPIDPAQVLPTSGTEEDYMAAFMAAFDSEPTLASFNEVNP